MNEVTTWKEQLAGYADEALEEVGAGGGQFISTRGGVLSIGGAPVPGNEMAVIIMDSIHENQYYTTAWDGNTVASPVCYAFSRTGKEMQPCKEAETPQYTECAGCQWAEWGSDDKGKGKACKEVRRLAIMSIGSFNKARDLVIMDDAADYIPTAEIVYLKVPVTSVKNFTNFVKSVGTINRLPPYSVIARVAIVPGVPAWKLLFERVADVPEELIPAILERRKEVTATIDFSYPIIEDKEEVEAPVKAKKSKY